MNLVILLKLLLAHILSDFLLQCNKICNGKESKTNKKYFYHLLHGLIHASITYCLVPECGDWIIAIVISHMLIDLIKTECMKKNLTSFIIDQLAHIVVIVFVSLCLSGNGIFFCYELKNAWKNAWNNTQILTIFIAYLLVLKPTSICLGLFFKKWNDLKASKNSLRNAGAWIGYFERILIITLMLIGNAEGIGFLLAAKSISRFGELNKAQEIRTTEYVLIGTLSSFTIAILIGAIVLHILQHRN